MRIIPKASVLLVVGALCGLLSQQATACPFCSAPTLTLSEQLAQSDAAVLVQWVEGAKRAGREPGSTTYEVTQVVKALTELGAKQEPLEKGTRVKLVRYRSGKKGDLFLLTGTKGTSIEWGSPLEVSETSFNYITQAPSPEVPVTKRLEYFLKFLEFPDNVVANDAYAEFANAPYKDIAPLAGQMDPVQIRGWVANPETPPTRLGLYGLLMGLCGTTGDDKLMEQLITVSTDEFRLGIDGVISGYLLMTRAKGLDVIDEAKLKNRDAPFSETYAAMQALRFMWTYGEERIGKERLRASMRILLDRPELADLVIADLARWKDWSVQDKLMKLYNAEEYSIPSIKRAIVRYMLVSTKDMPKESKDKPPAHVIKGRKHLKTLREKDEKTVREAERFFFLN